MLRRRSLLPRRRSLPPNSNGVRFAARRRLFSEELFEAAMLLSQLTMLIYEEGNHGEGDEHGGSRRHRADLVSL